MKYKIGDKFWRVAKAFNRLSGQANKVKMVDTNGVEWYRYDKDNISLDLMEVEVVGTYEPVIEGHSMWNEEEFVERYCLRLGEANEEVWKDKHEEVYEEELDGTEAYSYGYVFYFKTKEEAEEAMKEMREYHNSL